MYVCMYVCIYIYIYIYVCVCVCVCVCGDVISCITCFGSSDIISCTKLQKYAECQTYKYCGCGRQYVPVLLIIAIPTVHVHDSHYNKVVHK